MDATASILFDEAQLLLSALPGSRPLLPPDYSRNYWSYQDAAQQVWDAECSGTVI